MQTQRTQRHTYPTHVRIPNIAALISELEHGDTQDFFINLGGIRSSKGIQMLTGYKDNKPRFAIFNEIDGTRQTLNEKTLFDKTKTNIGDAMLKGNFYTYGD